jgi:hypothetical protein
MKKALVQTLTRRQFLKAAGAEAAGMALFGAAGCDLTERIHSNRPGGEPGANVVLVIIDSSRKDHVGAYGNDWIKTPNLDALAKESLRFTRPYPESALTICARRAIHTGTRTWPFKGWYVPQGETLALQGWQPIPNDQTMLAEMMRAAGYGTYFVTDNLHQYKPSYNFHRGFDFFDFFRGQTTDKFRLLWTCPPEDIQRTLISRSDRLDRRPALLPPVLRQRAASPDRGGLVRPTGVHAGLVGSGDRERGRAFLPDGGRL